MGIVNAIALSVVAAGIVWMLVAAIRAVSTSYDDHYRD